MKNKSQIKILEAEWLYDDIKPMSIQIYKLNYDFYFDLDDGYNDENERENLNQDGEQYVILNNCPNFVDMVGFPTFGGLNIEEAMKNAQKIIPQKLVWKSCV